MRKQLSGAKVQKALARRFPKFENYQSSSLPVFWSYVAVHSAANRLVGSLSRSLCMNLIYGAISLPGNEKHIYPEEVCIGHMTSVGE